MCVFTFEKQFMPCSSGKGNRLVFQMQQDCSLGTWSADLSLRKETAGETEDKSDIDVTSAVALHPLVRKATFSRGERETQSHRRSL